MMRELSVSTSFAYGWCLVWLLLGTAGLAKAQESRSLNVGTMLYTTNEALTNDDMAWPRALPVGGDRKEMLETYGVIVGVPRTWTDATGVTRDIQIAQVAQNKFSDIENVTPPVEDAFTRTYRYPYPDKILDGQNWADFQGRNDPTDPNLPADVVIYNHLDTWTGIDVERWAYAFANDAYDDFVILEHLFTNSSDESLSDVYFGITAEMGAHTYYPSDLWGTYYGATYANYAAGDASADSLRIYYAWDADQTSAEPTIDTRGKPDATWGNFQESQFTGITVLHADASAEDESDAPAQPQKAGWSQRELAPDLNVAGHEDIYAYLSQGWDRNNPGTYATTLDADGNVVASGTGAYRILEPGLAINDGTNFDPLTEQEKTALLSFGPYTLEPGQDVRIVTAFAAGQVPYRLAIDAGRAYESGQPQQLERGIVPLPYDVEDPFNGQVIAQQGTLLDRVTKNDILDLGLNYMLENASKAVRTWKNGSVQSGGGSFSIPMAPAAPSIEAFSEGDRIRLTWTDNTVNQNVTGWRIYREYKRPPEINVPTDTTFLLLTELPAGQTEYTDTDVTRGEDYYYYIAAVNEQGVESSAYLNRTGVTSNKEDEALTARQPAEENWEGNVVVVPNPYHVQAALKYPGRRLNFLNLPAYARIHIYTMTGDRIQTLEHNADAGDEDWEEQDTFSTMEIVSGVYIFVVEKLDGPGGSPNGEQTTGKFVVIK